MASATQKAAAEFTGTAFLLAAVVGSGIMAQRLAGGNVALALLCNTLATGAILPVIILIFGGVSGAHFNPAVSVAFALRGELAWRMASLYVSVQIAAAIAGAWVAHAMFELPIVQSSAHIRTGAAQWLAEGVATLGLLLVILGHRRSEDAPWMVSAWIGAAYWFTASTSFANPAITIARSLSDTFAGIRPVDILGFVIAQVAGALVALSLSRLLFAPLNASGRVRRSVSSPRSVESPGVTAERADTAR